MRASITRLGTRLTELEDTADQPRTPDHAQQLLGKLRSLDENSEEFTTNSSTFMTKVVRTRWRLSKPRWTSTTTM